MRFEEHKGVTIVHLDAHYSAFHEPLVNQAREELLLGLSMHHVPKVVLDFSQTEYFGSIFFDVLFSAWKQVKSQNGSLAFCSLRPECLELLQRAKTDTLWPIYPDAESAVDAIAGKGTNSEV